MSNYGRELTGIIPQKQEEEKSEDNENEGEEKEESTPKKEPKKTEDDVNRYHIIYLEIIILILL